MSRESEFEMEASFNVEAHYNGEKYLRINVSDLLPDTLVSLSHLNYVQETIEEWDMTQEHIVDLNIDNLNEEVVYTGKFNVIFSTIASYDSWTGMYEYDLDLKLTCKTYNKETYQYPDLSLDPERAKVFHASGNKEGDFIYVKKLPSGKLHLEYAHCCVRYGGRFIDVATLTRCLAEHLDDDREEKESSKISVKKMQNND